MDNNHHDLGNKEDNWVKPTGTDPIIRGLVHFIFNYEVLGYISKVNKVRMYIQKYIVTWMILYCKGFKLSYKNFCYSRLVY